MTLLFPLALCLTTAGCGPAELGIDDDRSIQVVMEDTGYAPFG